MYTWIINNDFITFHIQEICNRLYIQEHVWLHLSYSTFSAIRVSREQVAFLFLALWRAITES